MSLIKNFQGIKKGIDLHPLSKKYGKAMIYKRIIAWQATKGFYRNSGKQIEWINDRKLIIYPGRTSGVGNYYYGLLEYEPMSFLFHYLRDDDVFFDVGANVGVYSVLGMEAGKVVAFEPAKDTYDILMRNVNINHIGNAIIINAGIGAVDSKMLFTKGRDTVNHLIYDENDTVDTEAIDVRSIDSFSKENKLYPTVIKIDIEGAEFDAMRGGDCCLSDSKCNVVIMEIFSDSEKSRVMEEMGFRLYAYDPCRRILTETTPDVAGNNGIYIKDLIKAQKRVKEGKKIYYRGIEL